MQTDDPESPLGQKTPWTLGDRLMATKDAASLAFAAKPAEAKLKFAFDEEAPAEKRASDPIEPSRDTTEPLPTPVTGDESELSDILNRLAALSEPKPGGGAHAGLTAATPIRPSVATGETPPGRRIRWGRVIGTANLCLFALCIVLSLRLFYENAPSEMRAEWMQRLSVLQSTVIDMIARRDEALRKTADAAPPLASEIAPPQPEPTAATTIASAAPTPTSPERSKITPADAAADNPAEAAPTKTAVAPADRTTIAKSEPFAADPQVAPPAAPPQPIVAPVVAKAPPAEPRPRAPVAAAPPIVAAVKAPALDSANDNSSRRAELRPDDTEIAALMKRGDELLGTRDIAAARLFFERAGAAGSVRGAISAGKTYDPVYLTEMNIRGIRPDPAKAIEWYGKALAQGETGAQAMIARLR